MVSIGEIIGQLRYERKFSQAQLAKRIGLKSSSTIAAYESGARQPSLSRLVELSRALGVTTDYLLGVTKERTNSLDVSGLTPRQIESLESIIENYRACNQDNKNSGT